MSLIYVKCLPAVVRCCLSLSLLAERNSGVSNMKMNDMMVCSIELHCCEMPSEFTFVRCCVKCVTFVPWLVANLFNFLL